MSEAEVRFLSRDTLAAPQHESSRGWAPSTFVFAWTGTHGRRVRQSARNGRSIGEFLNLCIWNKFQCGNGIGLPIPKAQLSSSIPGRTSAPHVNMWRLAQTWANRHPMLGSIASVNSCGASGREDLALQFRGQADGAWLADAILDVKRAVAISCSIFFWAPERTAHGSPREPGAALSVGLAH